MAAGIRITCPKCQQQMTVPESVNIEVLEETPQQAYIVIPIDRAAISDDELDAASGGNSPWDPR